MKKFFIVAVLGLLAVTASAQRPDLNSAARLDRYKKENVNAPQGTVIFAGNSITEGWRRIRPEFFLDNNFLGRGISGQTSLGLLLRFRQDIIDLKPSIVVINIGTNDIACNNGPYQHQLTFDCIKSMAELADYHGIKVILSSVLPVKQYKWNTSVTDAPEKIAALNADIKAFADENGFGYIDYFTPMAEPDGALKAGYGNDGVHPNEDGYIVMEQQALKVINEMQKSKKIKRKKDKR